MNLFNLRDLIAGTHDNQWHSIPDGPFFRNAPYHGDDSYRSQHYSRAVLIDDIAVSIEWGLPTRDAENEAGHLWAKGGGFPDPHVYSFWIDVFYAGELVDRIRAYNVDGGRAYLPPYKQHRTDCGDPDDFTNATWRFTVGEWDDALTRLVNELSGLRYDEYLARARFERA